MISDISSLIHGANAVGLTLNHSKCEIMGLNSMRREAWSSSGFHFREVSFPEATLLGIPIHAQGVDHALASKTDDLLVLVSRLSLLPAHAALFLLKNALAIPKLLYILRTAPCSGCKKLLDFDDTLRSILISLLNTELSPTAWNQATLPLR